MEHVTGKFKFIDREGKEKEFETSPYSFNLEEDVIIKRFGKENIAEFEKTHMLNFKIQLVHIKEDFPKLLQGDLSEIDFAKQSGQYFDEMRRVYYFFLEYDSNEQLRFLRKSANKLDSNLEAVRTALNIVKAGKHK